MASRGLAHLLVADELEGLQLELPVFPLASFESVIGKFGVLHMMAYGPSAERASAFVTFTR